MDMKIYGVQLALGGILTILYLTWRFYGIYKKYQNPSARSGATRHTLEAAAKRKARRRGR